VTRTSTRQVLRLDLTPPYGGGANVLTWEVTARMQAWLTAEYPDWTAILTLIVGTDDSEREARALLRQEWVSKEAKNA
jgi:hypothetical protein